MGGAQAEDPRGGPADPASWREEALCAGEEAEIPVIDVALLWTGESAARVAAQIGAACRRHGFFYVRGHRVSAALQEALLDLSRRFFALPEERKQAIAMIHSGPAWRGYLPVNGELTSGRRGRSAHGGGPAAARGQPVPASATPPRPRPRGRRKLQEAKLPEECIELLMEHKVALGEAQRIGFEESSKLAWQRGGHRRLVVARAKYRVPGSTPQTTLLVTVPLPTFWWTSSATACPCTASKTASPAMASPWTAAP